MQCLPRNLRAGGQHAVTKTMATEGGKLVCMKKFTVITICLNAERDIEKTILSVLHQSSTDFEYIVKDGQSTDQTVAIAESFAPAFAKRGISYSVLSQKDAGIYDAMNQAIQQSQGEWLLFMNAGDRFAMNDVLSLVKLSGYLETAEIVYGDAIFMDGSLYCYRKVRPLNEFYFTMPFCHQSTFTKRNLFGKECFSTQYRIASDYAFHLEMYVKGKKHEYIPAAFSVSSPNGISATQWRRSLQERIQIYESMPERNEEAIAEARAKLEKKEKRAYRQLIIKLLPAGITRKIRERNKRKAGWTTEKRIEDLNAGYFMEAMRSFQHRQE